MPNIFPVVFIIIYFMVFVAVGLIPMLKIIRIRCKGVMAGATITNVEQTQKPKGKSTGVYSAKVRFKTESGKIISSGYFSQGDYLSLFQDRPESKVDIVYSRDNPNEFYLPKDKGNIGINIIFCIAGLIGAGIMIFIFFI